MFTGIVESMGVIDSITVTEDGRRLTLFAPDVAPSLAHGESLSVDGVCLTVEAIDDEVVAVFLADETVRRTTLEDRSVDDAVNLERAMPANGRFDGHLVQGHVDTTTSITAIDEIGEDWRFSFALPSAYSPYIVEKGSITIDGISLTIASQSTDSFDVAIIPTTYDQTTLKDRKIGDDVNIEVDIIAKYVESMLEERR